MSLRDETLPRLHCELSPPPSLYNKQPRKRACASALRAFRSFFMFLLRLTTNLKFVIYATNYLSTPPTYLGSIISYHSSEACIRRASTQTCRREETEAIVPSAHGGSIERWETLMKANIQWEQSSSHQLAEVRVEEWLVYLIADAHLLCTFKLGCAQLLEIRVLSNL